MTLRNDGEFLNYKIGKYQVKALDANSLTLNYKSFGKFLEIAQLMHEKGKVDGDTYREIVKILSGVDDNSTNQQLDFINKNANTVLALLNASNKEWGALKYL